MKRKFLNITLVVGAFAAVAWAGYDFMAREEGPRLTVQPMAYQADAALQIGQVHTVRFHLNNQSRHPARVVGLVTC